MAVSTDAARTWAFLERPFFLLDGPLLLEFTKVVTYSTPQELAERRVNSLQLFSQTNRACPLQRRGASASNPFSMKPGVDARVRSHTALHGRQRPVSLKMYWKPPLRATHTYKSLISYVGEIHPLMTVTKYIVLN